MKFKKEYIVLPVIIVVLLAYIVFQNKNKTNYELPHLRNIERKDISKIKIKKGSEVIDVEKKGANWVIMPKEYPADKEKIENLIDKASKVKLTALASESKKYEVYKLDEENRIEVELYQSDKPVRKIFIGKPVSSSRHTFIRLDDDYRVYHAEGNLRSAFNKDVDDLRNKKIWEINEEITKVTLIKDKKKLILLKKPTENKDKKEEKKTKEKEKISYKWQTEDGKDVIEGQITEIINMLKDFTCDRFIEDKKKDEFRNPIYKVILSGANSYSISFFDEKDGQYEAISSQSEYPFLVSEWRAKRIMKDFDNILKKKK
ncbi:MAG: DUF4340 domain-containing protein [Candidatus Schekmanbacteria bacterium]|nr:MAG: DUF4340 domain-containing protein [Candidatus Schekmanbacteria bacterium]